MSTNILDLKIIFEGKESTLNEINDKLAHCEVGNSEFCNALSAIVQQTLIAAGVSSDFSVSIKRSQIKKSYGKSGGLNANEWMRS